MATTSTIAIEYEERLVSFCPILNKLIRIFGSSAFNVLIAASTSVADLIADMYAALRTGTTELYGPEVRLLVQQFEQKIKLMETLGLIDDTIAAALTTGNSADASTDLGYLVSNIITLAGYDRTSENVAEFDVNFAYAVTNA